MPYLDTDEDILERLGQHVHQERGTLELNEKGKSDEDDRPVKTVLIGFQPNK